MGKINVLRRSTKVFIISLFVLVFVQHGKTQNMIVTAQSGQQLVDSLLGGGIVATNVSYSGHTQSKAAFSAGTSIGFPIDKGIILSTGFYTNVPGWNTSGSTSDVASGNSDADLQLLISSGNYTNDACVLEFDFVATADSIQFEYIFASEEYPEFACGGFNDVFAFMLSGQNPSGGNYIKKNLALIPGTSTFVSVNTVNAGVFGSMGAAANCSSIDPNWVSYSTYYNDNPKNMNVIKIKPDGYTDVFIAKAAVVSGQIYHIKLAIADVGYYDQGYDSYVFIKAKSFVAPGMNVAINANSATICAGSPVQLTATVTSGAPNYTYAWSNGTTNSNISTDTNSIYVNPLVSTSYVVTVTGSNGITATSTVAVTVSPAPTASIIYSGSPFCKSVTTSQLPSLTGSGTYTGGAYTSSPSGLSINGSTGGIIPSTSTAGTYIVTYTVAASGGCSAVTDTANVTITTAPTATISYPGSPFCSSLSTSQTVILTGTSGGIYTISPSGLSVNASTGAIIPNTSTAGNYIVTYTIAANGGCAAVSDTANVTITSAPTANVTYASSIFCKSVTTSQLPSLTGTGTYTGGAYTASPSGLSINGSTGGIIPSTSTAGTYIVTYTVAASGGCSAVTDTANVTITTAPTATISYLGSPYCSSLSTSQTVILTGASGGVYTVSPSGLSVNASTGAIIPNTSTAGNYIVTYTIVANGGCAAVSDTANVTITSAPTANVTYSSSIFCKSVTTSQLPSLTGSGTYTGGAYTASPSGLSINGSTGGIIPSTSTAGTYIVTYTVAASGGCSAVTDTANVTITTAPTATISYLGSPYCSSLSTSQTVLLTGTSGGIYTVSPSGLSVNASTGAIIPSTSTAGNYIVTYTIAANGGCAAVSDTANVTITSAPTANVTYASSIFCKSVTTTQLPSLTGSGTYTGGAYTASPSGLSINGSTGGIIPSTSTAGTYIVTYTVAANGGCSSVTDTANVTITTPPTATISYPGSPYCSSLSTSQTVILTGTSGGIYTVSPSGLSVNASTGAIIPNTSTAGNYIVTYTIAANGGCAAVSDTANVTITSAPTASIIYSGSPFCGSIATAQPATLTGTVGGTYTVTPSGLSINGSTGGIIPSTSTAGTYIVTYTVAASGGCASVTDTANVTITTPATATISYSGSPFCSSLSTSQTVILTGATGGVYTVSPSGLSVNASTGAIQPSTSTAGNYIVTYTIAANGGCAAVSDTANVTITSAPTASIIYSGSPFCGSIATAQPATLTGTVGGTYTVTPSGLSINGSTGSIVPSASTAGIYIVTYTVAANGGCASVTDTANVTITTAPTATISYLGSPFCSSLSTSQTVILTGATGGTFASTSGLSLNISTGAINPNLSTPGSYTIIYSIPATGGCQVIQVQTSIVINGLPTIGVTGTNTICTGESTTLTATGATSYIWSNGGAITASITVHPTLPNTTYTVTGTLSGCSNTANYNVSVNNPPTIVVNGNDTICRGETVTLGANGAVSYLWSNGLTTNSISVSPQATTTYTVTGTSNGCSDVENYIVVVLSKPILIITPTNPSCGVNDGIITTTVSGGNGIYSYQWSNNQVTNSINNLAPGTYLVTVSDGHCSTTGNATLLDPNINLQAGMHISPRVTNFLDGTVLFNDNSVGDIVSWNWNLGDGSTATGSYFQHFYSNIGTYTVTLIVENAGGCTDTIQDSVIVTDVFTLYVPNAFTPDGNSSNDGFYATGIGIDPTSFKMYVYDRWGGLQFYCNQWVDNRSYPAWNGSKSNSGSQLPIGVYTYKIFVLDMNGKQYSKVGSVSIIK